MKKLATIHIYISNGLGEQCPAHEGDIVIKLPNPNPPKNDTDPLFDRLIEKMWQDI